MGDRDSFWRKHKWVKWLVGGMVVALVAAAAVVSVLLHRAEPFLRARIVESLQNHFHARVELDSFHVSLLHGLWAEGNGLRIWPPVQVEGVSVPGPAGSGAAAQVEPLIRLDEFRFHAPLHYKPGVPVHISVVQLKGLHVNLPPRSHFQHPQVTVESSKPKPGPRLLSFQVDTLECTGADLVLGTSKPGKQPLDFQIARFKLTHISSGAAMGFDAELTNPRPVGLIHSTGSFGPWSVADPGESPIDGDYRFDHADLAIFKGIAGILNSTGHYQGTLRELVADGEADVPDFRLTHFGNALPLHTRFHARIDATNGDTWLEPVDAMLGHAHFTAQGQIVRVVVTQAGQQPHSVGHDIALNIIVKQAPIEDFLHLASHSATPLLTGNVTLKAALHIPPGPVPVHERMTLIGKFELDQARFANSKIQDRIRELSMRGQGRPGDLKTSDSESMRSYMQGDFNLGGGTITLSTLDYTVPGADIQLKGTYGMEDGALNFEGTAKMEATVSKMVGGWKGMLLKPADRFFRKDGAGTEVPIHISGTREAPKFAVDFDRLKTSVAEKPGEKP